MSQAPRELKNRDHHQDFGGEFRWNVLSNMSCDEQLTVKTSFLVIFV